MLNISITATFAVECAPAVVLTLVLVRALLRARVRVLASEPDEKELQAGREQEKKPDLGPREIEPPEQDRESDYDPDQ